MAGIPLNFSTDQHHQMGTTVSTFFKWPGPPSSSATIVEVKSGLVLDLVLYATEEGEIIAWGNYRGAHVEVTLNPTHHATDPGWFWASVNICPINGHNDLDVVRAQLWDHSGNTDGQQTASASVPGAPFYESLVCSVGWGVDLGNGAGNWPADSGYELTCLCVQTVGDSGAGDPVIGVMDPPSAEPTTALSHVVALYLCHEGVGDAPTIHDATSNHYDLTAGPQRAVIVQDSPFV